LTEALLLFCLGTSSFLLRSFTGLALPDDPVVLDPLFVELPDRVDASLLFDAVLLDRDLEAIDNIECD
jgi:hypothetical protein